MKKIYVILAVVALSFCVASCGGKKASKEAEVQTEEVAPAVVDSVEVAEEAPVEEVAE
ncbi:MAG TPA: hypothetical protein PLU97_00285 [Candidatus Cryptobacteroides sp.]|jgi:PBP1b-binding outer membrane lipoprotein LpoB|nr:hypothetical protein [Rikenellaceae bacterium]HOE93819.1 hypothetical protein [Candidatus Cryptobacteroides sp.]